MASQRTDAATLTERPDAVGLTVEEDRAGASTSSSMRVTKRDGSSEPVDVTKIVRAVERCCAQLEDVDALRVATRTISGLYDGATTRELDELCMNHRPHSSYRVSLRVSQPSP